MAVAEAKTRAWEGFGEAMENYFRTGLKRFWTTIWHLRKGKCTVNTVNSGDGVLLTSIKDVVDRWRDCFEDLLNLTNARVGEKARPRAPGMGSLISGVEVAKDVKKLLVGRAPEVEEFLMTLQRRMAIGRGAAGLVNWSGLQSVFLRRGTGGCVLL